MLNGEFFLHLPWDLFLFEKQSSLPIIERLEDEMKKTILLLITALLFVGCMTTKESFNNDLIIEITGLMVQPDGHTTVEWDSTQFDSVFIEFSTTEDFSSDVETMRFGNGSGSFFIPKSNITYLRIAPRDNSSDKHIGAYSESVVIQKEDGRFVIPPEFVIVQDVDQNEEQESISIITESPVLHFEFDLNDETLSSINSELKLGMTYAAVEEFIQDNFPGRKIRMRTPGFKGPNQGWGPKGGGSMLGSIDSISFEFGFWGTQEESSLFRVSFRGSGDLTSSTDILDISINGITLGSTKEEVDSLLASNPMVRTGIDGSYEWIGSMHSEYNTFIGFLDGRVSSLMLIIDK
jgi:hypothetical protein